MVCDIRKRKPRIGLPDTGQQLVLVAILFLIPVRPLVFDSCCIAQNTQRVIGAVLVIK